MLNFSHNCIREKKTYFFFLLKYKQNKIVKIIEISYYLIFFLQINNLSGECPHLNQLPLEMIGDRIVEDGICIDLPEFNYQVCRQSPPLPNRCRKPTYGFTRNCGKICITCRVYGDIDLHMHDLCHIHDHISNQFNESFASFLYGLSMTMWCVDFPGCPSREQWEAPISKRKEKRKN